MKIIDCGLTVSEADGCKNRLAWVRGDDIPTQIAVCVNSQIFPDVVLSEDRSVLTFVVPVSLLAKDMLLSIQLLNLLSGEITEAKKIRTGAVIENNRRRLKGEHILISCFPKSGSTLLLGLLAKATGYLSWPMVYEYGGNEQDLYLPSVVDAYFNNTVTQQHVRATTTNLTVIEEYGFKTVVLTRNIFDTLVSLHDHLINESYEIPLLYIDHDFELMSFERRIDMLIDLALPWYISFYASWYRRFPDPYSDLIHWMQYDELVGDPRGSVEIIARKFGLPIVGQADEISQLLSNGQATRLNVGVPGRGIQKLSNLQKERVLEMLNHHQNVNFSRIL